MSAPVSFTLDLEDLRTSPAQEERVGVVTNRLLDRLGELSVTGTVFCVADLARSHPELIARIAADGHEVGVHGLHHVPLDLLGADRFREEALEARDVLEDLSGGPVVGFRAPQFSLVPESAWAPAILTELGFRYSSSVLPAASPLYGWPGAPRHPFRWPSGLVELPCPVVEVGGRALPFLGGAYLRLLPAALRRRGLRQLDASSVPWTYCHPWDFDPDERFYVYEHGGLPASLVGWANRKGMLRRVERVLAAGAGPRLCDVAAAVSDAGDLPTFRAPDPDRDGGRRAAGASGATARGVLRGRLRSRPDVA